MGGFVSGVGKYWSTVCRLHVGDEVCWLVVDVCEGGVGWDEANEKGKEIETQVTLNR